MEVTTDVSNHLYNSSLDPKYTSSTFYELALDTTTLTKTTIDNSQTQDTGNIPTYIYIMMAAGAMLGFLIISIVSLVFGFHACKSRRNTSSETLQKQ